MERNTFIRLNKLLRLSEQERGSVLIVTLIILVLLTLLGISATTTTSIEIQIAGNDMIYRENLYLAEASSMEAVQTLEDTDLESVSPTWLVTAEDVITENEVRDETNWDNNFGGDVSAVGAGLVSGCQYIALFEGMDEVQESIDMSKSRIHSYSIFGRSNRKNGVGIVRLGYRKAF